MNYAQLTSAIQGFAENSFPDTVGSFISKTQTDTFIRNAEQAIYNTVQPPAERKYQTLTTVANTPIVSAPTGWLATFSMGVVDPTTQAVYYLLNKDVNFVQTAFVPTLLGRPSHYAIYNDTQFLLGPTPNAAYSLALNYFAYPTSIVDSADGTSWLGINFDRVLLYGALKEAANFMKSDPDVVQLYNNTYNEAIAELKQLVDGRDRSDAYRVGQVTYKVK